MDYIPLYIKNLCFNCGNLISSYRLSNALPCEEDLNENEILDLINIKDENEFMEILYKKLKEKNRLKNFEEIYKLYKETKQFKEFFNSLINNYPWKIQLMWFKRLYKNSSFSMIAPTGIGKSTFITVASIYFSWKYNKRVLIVLPTRLLVKQALDKFNEFLSKLNLNLDIAYYYGNNKKELKEKIKEGNYKILIISNQFLSKNFDLIKDKKFDIVFIDDVDSFFKGSKNIERIFNLIGYDEEEISLAKRIIDLKLSGRLDFNSDIYKKFLEIKKKNVGIIVLSSATGSLRGKRVLLYKELANFTVGTGSSKIRNITDIYYYPTESIENEVLKLIKILNDGILIFVPKDKGVEYMKELYEFLKKNNVNIEYVSSEVKNVDEIIKNFSDGKINVLIGISDPYGILVRGLDIPERIKYAIFVGIPKIKINLTKLDKNINNILILSSIISSTLPELEKINLNRKVDNIRKNLKKLSSEALRLINEYIKGNNVNLEGYNKKIAEDILWLYNKISEYIKDKEIIEKIKENPDVSTEIVNNDIYIKIVDLKSYIQASGRTSRLYAGGITKGLSIVIVDDEKLLKSLDTKLRYYLL
ncbi:reverse gyrase [Nanoarchaeota archaeon]